jgi:hypothetical protein
MPALIHSMATRTTVAPSSAPREAIRDAVRRLLGDPG